MPTTVLPATPADAYPGLPGEVPIALLTEPVPGADGRRGIAPFGLGEPVAVDPAPAETPAAPPPDVRRSPDHLLAGLRAPWGWLLAAGVGAGLVVGAFAGVDEHPAATHAGPVTHQPLP